MATTIDTVPTLNAAVPHSPTYDEKHSEKASSGSDKGSFIDEKGAVKPARITDADEIGDVFAEGPRAIDLGADGKERPIGSSLAPTC